MKKSFLCLLALVVLIPMALAQVPNEKLAAATKSALTAYQAAKTPDEVQQVANQWERIAAAEPKEWLPAYWAAYTNLMLHYRAKDEKVSEAALEKTGEWIEKSEKLAGKNDEVAILTAWYYQAKLGASPATGWMLYGGKITRNIEKAKLLNPENPRIYLVEGQNLFYTPSAFGGGKDKALPLFKAGEEKFAKFVPVSDLHPNWGRGELKKYLAECEAPAK
jgi:hypothetical protein